MFERKIEWFERTGREASNFAKRTDFYRRACEEAFRRGEVVLIELVVDATLVAAQLAFAMGTASTSLLTHGARIGTNVDRGAC